GAEPSVCTTTVIGAKSPGVNDLEINSKPSLDGISFGNEESKSYVNFIWLEKLARMPNTTTDEMTTIHRFAITRVPILELNFFSGLGLRYGLPFFPARACSIKSVRGMNGKNDVLPIIDS